MPRLVHSNGFHYAQYFPVDLMDLLFNQVEIFHNNILAETTNQYIL